MNTSSPLRWAISAAVTFSAWSAFGQTVNPANQIAWPQVTGSGAPTAACTAANYGQPYTDIAPSPNQNYTCGSHGWALSGSGGGGGGTFTSNLGVGANNSSAYAPVNEVNYKTTGGNTAFACQEDQNHGDWDVRCIRSGVSWASNPSQALINTIQAAMCYHYTQGGPFPTVHLPAGSYSIGGNISLPPLVDVEGAGDTDYGELTILTTNDPTQAMFTQVGSEVFTCNGTSFTDNSGTATMGNVALNGNGSGHQNDVGLINFTGNSTNSYVHNMQFNNFGGPGYTVSHSANGQNSRGTQLFASSNLQWYYFSGAYNPTGFTDPFFHCSLELNAVDSQWDHLQVFGQLQDTGYYNRYLLGNVCVGGGRLTDSFIQIAPNLVINTSGADRFTADNNRLDDAWWYAFNMQAPGNISDNTFNGYCTSPTLNPVNFPSNPGGVSTDPNCSSMFFNNAGLGSVISHNVIVEDPGLWASWPAFAIYFPGNSINQAPSVVEEPRNMLGPQVLGGFPGGLGFNSGSGVNPGADVGQSMFDFTQPAVNNTGGTAHFNYSKHMNLNDSAATTYSNFDGLYPDAYVSINVGGNDTIQNGGAFHTCTGGNLTGTGWSWWWLWGSTLFQQACAGGGGGGSGISGLTANFIPLAGGSTTLTANSPLDYGVTTPNVVTSSKPLAVADGSGQGGQFVGQEGTAPTGTSGTDFLWADSTSHRLKMNNNNAGAFYAVGISTPAAASGNIVRFAANGIDLVDGGAPSTNFTPTKVAAGGAGTGATTSLTAGSNDDSGWVTLNTGTGTTGGLGLITFTYGGTYSNIRHCTIEPASATAAALTGGSVPYIPIGTSTTTQFVITGGPTALTASTTYQWTYRCSN